MVKLSSWLKLFPACRASTIAAAFAYLNIVEVWGSGIPRMFREAEEYNLREPELIDMGSDFRVNLYRKSMWKNQNSVNNLKGGDTNDAAVKCG